MSSLHDEIQSQINNLLDDEVIENGTHKEKTKQIKNRLKWDIYVQDEADLNPQECSLYNPAIDKFLDNLHWKEDGWEYNLDTRFLMQYPDYVPSDESIKYICNNDRPIVEIGAGNGYWSHVINKNGMGRC
jgi:hypothetical protein